MSEAALFGREHELRVLEQHIDAVNERGRALLIRGNAGVGKTALLEAATTFATGRGMSILSAAGLKPATHLPFAGLHELLHPILDRAERLPAPHQLALQSAFGLANASADLFVIALAALNLLSEVAAERPTLIVVDDAQWLDPSSIRVLTFIARRLQSEPIVFLAASRDNDSMPPDVLPEFRVERLGDAEALALLQTRYPNLTPDLRDRVLRAAQGNPLALVELPKAPASASSIDGVLSEHLPFTARLEQLFAPVISELPSITRQLLLIAVVNDRPSLVEAIAAANLMNETPVSLDALTPAISARLVRMDSANLYFNCAMARSAIYHSSTFAERIACHSALAQVLRDDPVRAVWHQAAATVGSDDTVAESLRSAADRAQLSGDVRAAIHGLERAAQLSTDRTMRAKWLVRAAELAFDIGLPAVALELLRKIEVQDLEPRDRVKLTLFRETAVKTVPGAQALRDIVASVTTCEDVDVALDLLSSPATIRWWGQANAEVSNRVIAALESTCAPTLEDPRFLLILALTLPIDRGASVIDALHRFSARSNDPRVDLTLGTAATLVGDFELSTRFITIAEASLRDQGRLALLAQALVLRSWCAIYLGNREAAIADAVEGERLAIDTEQPTYASGGRAAAALLAAWRGDYDTSDRLATEAEQMTGELRTILPEIHMAKGTNALCAGRYEEAYHHFARMFEDDDNAYHHMREYFWIGDFVEAALQSGHHATAKEKLLATEDLALRTPSPQLHDALHYARAMLADRTTAEEYFESGIAAIKSALMRARLQLAFGRWLRRARRGREARTVLRRALESFEHLGVHPWSERARKELRALGVIVERRTPQRRERLTPQELQIALMAADGLSNREIGQRLYLSHRTVSTHLYHIFPKLDITSRYQLRSALASESTVAV